MTVVRDEELKGEKEPASEESGASGTPRLIFKALGLLLTYPEQELVSAMGELSQLFEQSELSLGSKRGLLLLTDSLSQKSLLDSQEAYVRLFDRSNRLSLYLYEHVHGESRDRGQAMVDLRTHYERFGLVATEKELPDYVPVLCEFVSLLDEEAAKSLLDEIAPLFALIGSRLEERKSLYAGVFSALLELAKVEVDCEEVARATSEDGVPLDDSFESLDKVWAEAEVTFGVGDALDSCRQSTRPQGSDLVQLKTTKQQEERDETQARTWTGLHRQEQEIRR